MQQAKWRELKGLQLMNGKQNSLGGDPEILAPRRMAKSTLE